MRGPRTAHDPVAVGWDALRSGEWRRARACFEEALAGGESAEAFEGLGWSAYCLDDDRLTLEARERAYRLYRAQGDDQSAARVAAWLAADWAEFRGETAVCNGWLQRAHRLLAGHEAGPGHGWLAVHEASMLIDDDPATARRLAVGAAELGPALRGGRAGSSSRLSQGSSPSTLPTRTPRPACYHLPDGHRPVLVDEDDLSYFTPWAGIAIDVLHPLEQLVDAYRSSAGVPFEAYGPDLVGAIGAANRPQFLNLIGEWLASVPEVDTRLRAAPPARVADVACGTAQSSIAIARAYPDVTVRALDVDATSIERARTNVAAAGLTERVRPYVDDASAPDMGGPYDLVTIFEALHDMNHPVEALRAARASLAPGGSVVIADERVADRFAPPGDEIERVCYGFSVLHCLAVGLLDESSAGTGTVIRADTVRRYATDAGFSGVDVLPIEHDFWRFYRLIP